MRRFLLTLSYWGFRPRLVVSDGSNLYPAVLQEVWPQAKHQLCVFHVLQDVTNQVLAAARRLRRGQARRGQAGRKARKGRRGPQGQARARRRGPTLKEKAAFVYKHRFLIVKRAANLTRREWADLCVVLLYLPELRPLRSFCQQVYELFSPEQVARLARRRQALLLKQADYREVPELAKALGLLEGAKFDKMVAFLECPAGARVRTNNHVERANRKLRFDEKVRYQFRSGRSLERFLRLRLGLLDRQAAGARPAPGNPGSNPNTGPSSTSNRGGD
jgi:hypothetical protein